MEKNYGLYVLRSKASGNDGICAANYTDDEAIETFRKMCSAPTFPRRDYLLIRIAKVTSTSHIYDANTEIIKDGSDWTDEELVDTYTEKLREAVARLNAEIQSLTVTIDERKDDNVQIEKPL